MKKTILLGLVGPSRSGKDTIGNWLEFYNFKKRAVADRIKTEYFKKINYNYNLFEKDKLVDNGIKIRNKLWEYSDNVKLEKGENYFIDLILKDIKRNTVITDIRTTYELDKISKLNFQIILILDRDFNYNDIIPESRIKWKDVLILKPIIIENFRTLKDFFIEIDKKLKLYRK